MTVESRGLSDPTLALRICAWKKLWVSEGFQWETLVDDLVWGARVFGLTTRETSRGKWWETKLVINLHMRTVKVPHLSPLVMVHNVLKPVESYVIRIGPYGFISTCNHFIKWVSFFKMNKALGLT